MEYLASSYVAFLFAGIIISGVITRTKSLAISDRLDYSSDGLIGTNATFGCNWVKDDAEFSLTLSVVTQSNKVFLFYNPIEPTWRNGPNFHPRLQVTNTNTSLAMTVTNISCSDIDRYICKMEYFTVIGGYQGKNSTGRPVDIKISPQVPVMTEPPSLVVSEGSSITYKCVANGGRPNKGQILWNAYINGQKFEQTLTPIGKETNSDNGCTVIVESTVTLQANRTIQNLTLACFATSQDFPSQTPPSLCTTPSTDLCDQSQPLNIIYAVSNLIVNMIPQRPVEEFSTITLTCQAEGNPQPTYTWLQVGNENRSLSAVQDGLTNKLTLTNLSLANDAGVYNCTATNNINGVNYSVTDQVSVSVFPKTTTTSTTTTTRSTTPSTSRSPTGSNSQATAPQNAGGDDDNTNTIIIAVVVPLACIIIIIIVVVIVCVKKRKQPKSIIEEPSVKPYNNLSMVNQNFNKSPKPDLVTGDKKFNNDNLDSKNYQSGDQKNDALQYVDLNYDNQPRSRKPIALSDASSTSEDYFPEV